jgi:hypothetical protein
MRFTGRLATRSTLRRTPRGIQPRDPTVIAAVLDQVDQLGDGEQPDERDRQADAAGELIETEGEPRCAAGRRDAHGAEQQSEQPAGDSAQE